MATTCGPELLVDAAPVEVIDLPRAPITSPQVPPPTNLPPPNPHFVFPPRDPGATSPASAPSSYSRATGRRSKSALLATGDLAASLGAVSTSTSSERPRRTSPALPEFSFNPGASLPSPTEKTLLSPPLSPQSPRAIPSPGRHGHRRGGSEYVGGSIRDGDTIMSTSPTKAEGEFPAPPIQPPPAGRRGRHSHRRSAAISSHDLSIILQPASVSTRGSSAPTSPAEFRHGEPSPTPEHVLKPMESEPILKAPDMSQSLRHGDLEEAALPAAQPSPPRAIPRARVGFSETVEFIPRPLSLVSSDTSSTMTMRPGHSVSGSISSIVSATTPVLMDREMFSPHPQIQPSRVTPSEPSPTREATESRPNTAHAVLERRNSDVVTDNEASSAPRRRNSIPALRHTDAEPTVSGEPSPTKAPKRPWSFFGLEPPFITPNAHNRSRPVSSSSADSTGRPTSSSASSGGEHVSDSALDDANQGRCENQARRTATKKKKVKQWAGSILTLRAKTRAKAKGDDDQSAMANSEEEEVESGSAAQQDAVIATATEPTDATDSADGTPESASPTKPDESSHPMIDLDAALGPFNTPLPHNPEWEAAQRAAGNTKRQLHSAQGMKGFSGPGMHYHRRAESAPEMAPFEAGKFGIHRFGSSSTMADVFEEEEEDEEAGNARRAAAATAAEAKSKDGDSSAYSDGEATPPAVAVSTAMVAEPTVSSGPHVIRRRASASFEPEICPPPMRSIRSEHSTNSLHDEVIHEEPAETMFQQPPAMNNSPSNSSTPSPRRTLAGRDLAPVDISPLQLPTLSHVPVSPYSMSHGSSFPSPRSPISIDAQRISTAPSSVNDEHSFQSLLLGQPGPELRISVDDIPSLTSSNSTMTRESGYTPNQYGPHVPFQSQRPASVSSAAFGRRRSSLASLSRLISSSHGERSKLSMEVSCETESVKKAKTSKTKRLSRMVQFWKSKEQAEN